MIETPYYFLTFAAAVNCFSVTATILQATNSYEVDASRSSWPADGFCRILHKERINAGHPYTMTLELFNVIGNGVVDLGHPGMIYNVIDENNFDFVFFRLLPNDVHFRTKTLSLF